MLLNVSITHIQLHIYGFSWMVGLFSSSRSTETYLRGEDLCNYGSTKQIKSHHFYCHITTAHVSWRVKFLRACSRQCRNNLHIDSTYIQTYTEDNVQNTHTLYTQCTIKTYLQLSIHIIHRMYTFDILYTYIHTIICAGAADYT